MGVSAHERLLAEVGRERLGDIRGAIIMLLPCPRCGVSVCKPCVTVDGKSPGTPTLNHIARVRNGSALYQIWHRMVTESLSRIDKEEVECLRLLGVG